MDSDLVIFIFLASYDFTLRISRAAKMNENKLPSPEDVDPAADIFPSFVSTAIVLMSAFIAIVKVLLSLFIFSSIIL